MLCTGGKDWYKTLGKCDIYALFFRILSKLINITFLVQSTLDSKIEHWSLNLNIVNSVESLAPDESFWLDSLPCHGMTVSCLNSGFISLRTGYQGVFTPLASKLVFAALAVFPWFVLTPPCTIFILSHPGTQAKYSTAFRAWLNPFWLGTLGYTNKCLLNKLTHIKVLWWRLVLLFMTVCVVLGIVVQLTCCRWGHHLLLRDGSTLRDMWWV